MKNYELTITCNGEVKNVEKVSESDVLRMYFDIKEKQYSMQSGVITNLDYGFDGVIKTMTTKFNNGYVYSYKQIKEENENLPTEVELTLDDLDLSEKEKEVLLDKISNALSNKYGFCHDGWEDTTLKMKGVDWDTTE